jgi:radical SAM superfamily enzyme YgiQ (UPF0313 family)
MIGGFHVSGSIAMLPSIPPEIQAAIDDGMTVVAGEAETRWGELLRAAYDGTLLPFYNFIEERPSLAGVPPPFAPSETLRPFMPPNQTSFDAGRGCPFKCSFCTIINVQGRKSRHRTADDVEQLLRAHLEEGVIRFFITDDDFARNRHWEQILDRIIELREGEKLPFTFLIQVDALAYRIPHFVEKCRRAGCLRVFIGLETINAANLLHAKKRQNKIADYRRMLQAWRSAGIITFCGYILGFPNDTVESILHDIDVIKAAAAAVLGFPLRRHDRLQIDPASITTLDGT